MFQDVENWPMPRTGEHTLTNEYALCDPVAQQSSNNIQRCSICNGWCNCCVAVVATVAIIIYCLPHYIYQVFDLFDVSPNKKHWSMITNIKLKHNSICYVRK